MKYQLICPKCKHEFTYDNGYYDKNIVRLGQEIREITLQLQEHRLLPWSEQKARTDWFYRTKRALAAKQKELGELKAIRKVSDQQLDRYFLKAFKSIVKEECGEEVYTRLRDKALAELEAYKVSGLMRHEYTRSSSKSNVTSISKL